MQLEEAGGTAARLTKELLELSSELERASVRVSSLQGAHMEALSKLEESQKALEANSTEATKLMKDRRDREDII